MAQERGALTIHRHVVPAQQAASYMTRIEAITDSDIAEVEESTNVFEGVREATEPLCAFLSLISAEWLMGVFDAAPKEAEGEAAHQGPRCPGLRHTRGQLRSRIVFDGNLGDPIAIARGAVSVSPTVPRNC